MMRSDDNYTAVEQSFPERRVEPETFMVPLSGRMVTEQSLTTRPVTAVMIENSPDARPQSGLKQAAVVYEAVAEGGITRFLVLYQDDRPELIGPVRSLRPYYVDWAAGYDAAVAHVGGSARSLEMIRSGGYGLDIDQFFNGNSYYRASDRYAPHNVYTTSDRLDALISSKGKASSIFTPFTRQDTPTERPAPTASSIDIPVSTGAYAVNYVYQPDSNTYRRSLGGAIHTDREKGDIAPDVVVALSAPQTRVFEDGYRESYEVIGSGKAVIFQNGQHIVGQWSKPDARASLRLLDASGADIALNRGQTWITVVPNTKEASWRP
jgi:hypothetical protein